MNSKKGFCTTCGKDCRASGSNLEICRTCNLYLWCKSCSQKRKETHKDVCLHCSGCGVQTSALKLCEGNSGDTTLLPSLYAKFSHQVFCHACRNELEENQFRRCGWVRGGGQRGCGFLIRDGVDYDIIDIVDTEEDMCEREEPEPDPSTLEKRGILPIPDLSALNPADNNLNLNAELPSKLKPLMKEFRSAINTRFSRLDPKYAQLKTQITDAIAKCEEFVQDSTLHLNLIRKTLFDKKLDEAKLELHARNLGERCASDILLQSLSKSIDDANAELLIRQANFAQLEKEHSELRAPVSKSKIEKKQKEIDELEKSKSRLANDLKQAQGAAKKVEEAWKSEESKLKREIATLKNQINQVGVTESILPEDLEEELKMLDEEIPALEEEVKVMTISIRNAKRSACLETSDPWADCYMCLDSWPTTLMAASMPCCHPMCNRCLKEVSEKGRDLSVCDSCAANVTAVLVWLKDSIDPVRIPIVNGKYQGDLEDLDLDDSLVAKYRDEHPAM